MARVSGRVSVCRMARVGFDWRKRTVEKVRGMGVPSTDGRSDGRSIGVPSVVHGFIGELVLLLLMIVPTRGCVRWLESVNRLDAFFDNPSVR